MRLHEIPDREEVLAVIGTRAAPDDLLELDYGADRAHQHDMADVAGIDARRQLLRGRQDCRNCLGVVLEVAKVLLAHSSVIGGDAVAVVRVLAVFHLVD